MFLREHFESFFKLSFNEIQHTYGKVHEAQSRSIMNYFRPNTLVTTPLVKKKNTSNPSLDPCVLLAHYKFLPPPQR